MTVISFDIPSSWKGALQHELEQPYMVSLKEFLDNERSSGHAFFPKDHQIFHALELTPFEAVSVVIVGQDPYHGPGQAHGLSFSVPNGVDLPPSLKNIFKELQSDLGISSPQHGCLNSWARQGVLLLNATLTVRSGEPLSHHKKGWEQFTDAIIEAIAKNHRHVVFLLWGKKAEEKCQKYSALLQENHLVLTAPHPSPFSAHGGFFGCRHFSKTNAYLKSHSKRLIDWC